MVFGWDRKIMGADVSAFCESCSMHIQEKTGFEVCIRPKQPPDMFHMLENIGEHTSVDCPAPLLAAGNCILAALYHLGFGEQALAMEGRREHPHHLYFQRRKHRTYEQVSQGCDVPMSPRFCLDGAEASAVKSVFVYRSPAGAKILMHIVRDGKPHCVAVEFAGQDKVHVKNGRMGFSVTRASFQTIVDTATYVKPLVFFFLAEYDEKINSQLASSEDLASLLEMQAAGDNGDDGLDLVIDVDDNRDILPMEAGEDESGAEEAEEHITKVADEILAAMKVEVGKWLRSAANHQIKAEEGVFRCPLCPFRSWPTQQSKSRVLQHMQKHHVQGKQYVPSGTKQLKVTIALHDCDQCRRRTRQPNLLKRSAAMLRSTVSPPLSSKDMNIDRHIRLVLTGHGPQYWNAETVFNPSLRRVRNMYYTHEFAQMLFQDILTCDAKVYALHARMTARFPGEVSSLLPRHSRHWWPLIEDVFSSGKVTGISAQLAKELLDHEEMQAISIDATLRCCLPILGQVHPRASKKLKDIAVFAGEMALTRVLTCRGRTNAVLLMDTVAGDDSEQVVKSLTANLSAAALAHVQFVSVDNPSYKYWQALRTVCPNLQVMMLDPTHLAMTFEYASSRKRTPGSKALRAVLQKLSAVDLSADARSWGLVHTGANSRPLTVEERRVRNQIEDRSMRKADAAKILNSLEVDKRFYLRLEWIKAAKALACRYRISHQCIATS
ncbi:unnamed protein product [Symbiodinium sp. CCMP2592]|nr:unnamed protein product [Symbiodinium sp. CCMP2592]